VGWAGAVGRAWRGGGGGRAVEGAGGDAGFQQDGLSDAAAELAEELAEGGIAMVPPLGSMGNVLEIGEAGQAGRAAFDGRFQVAQRLALGGAGEFHAELGHFRALAHMSCAALVLVFGDGGDGVQGSGRSVWVSGTD
jgi:hypothetical protein